MATPIEAALSEVKTSISAIWARLNQISNSSGQVVLTTGSAGTLRTKGTGTIASGSTSTTITHGAGTTPLVQDIYITPSANTTTDPGNLWVDTITSTQFNVNCRTNPGAGGMAFGWTVLLA